jgi:biotin transport system substrate-specific component
MSVRAVQPSLLSHVAAKSPAATLVRVAAVLFAAALVATAAQFTVPLPFTSVPFTLQPIAVLLTAAALGSRLGPAAQVAYLAAGIVGLPVWSASPLLPPGPARLLGPTGGYLMAYPLAAFVTGWLAERSWDRRYVTAALAMVAGLVVIYAGGVSWFAISQSVGVGAAIAAAFVPFFLLDLAKIAVGAAVLPRLWQFFRGTSASA